MINLRPLRGTIIDAARDMEAEQHPLQSIEQWKPSAGAAAPIVLPWGRRQTKSNVVGGTSITVTFDLQPVVGSGIVVGLSVGGTGFTPLPNSGLTDNAGGNTYALAKSAVQDSLGNATTGVYYCAKLAASVSPFTLTYAPGIGSNGFLICAMEIGGVGAGLAVAGISGFQSGISNYVNSGSVNMAAKPKQFACAVSSVASQRDMLSLVLTGMVPDVVWRGEASQLVGRCGAIASREFDNQTGSSSATWTWTNGNEWWTGCQAVFNAT